MSPRVSLVALGFLLAGVVLFAIVCLSTIAFLDDSHCGAGSNYLGCETTAEISNGGDQVAGRPRVR